MKTIKIFAYALMATSAVTLTSCGDDDTAATPLPPIGGYNNANEVAAADLVAHWPLDGNGTERISGTAPNSTTGVTYVASTKGQAANFNDGFMKYPSIAALSQSMTSFSMSAWAKVTNNGSSGSVFLSLSRPNEWAGNINFLSETGWMPATSDSITVKGQIVSDNAFAWQDSRNATKVSTADAANGHIANPNKVGGQWMHAVITFDGATRMFKVYVNGQKVSNPAWELRGDATSPAIAFTTPTYPVIGAFATTANGTPTDTWDRALKGQLDEIRVYKKALSQADIGFLYELEKAGR